MTQRHILIVSTECEPGHEAEFHRWYDEVHLPQVFSVPGFVSVVRYERETGEDDENRWLTVYEIEGELSDIQAGLAALDLTLIPAYLRSRTTSRFYRPL